LAEVIEPGLFRQARVSKPATMGSDVLIVSAAPTILDPSMGASRESIRPQAFRGPDFDNQFDAETLFYDAFVDPTGTHIVTVGPPPLNLRRQLAHMEAIALPVGSGCAFRIKEFDRHSQIWIVKPKDGEQLKIRSALGEFVITPRPNLSDHFADKRVLFTLSNNNRLDWIADWIRYHRDIHAANAILIYDNASTNYSPAELADMIAGISGIERACVVNWPFKYGPQGLGAKRFWDSDYCQNGALEHARWCFLARARSAMNSDVDELVVSHKEGSVFEAAERSLFGVVRYRGVWMPGIEGTTRAATDLTHRDFEHTLQPRRARRWGYYPVYEDRCPPKWTVVPRRCPAHAQWTAHSIKNWVRARLTSSRFSYRHFREINNNWKYDRSARVAFDPVRHARDDIMTANFSRVRWDS
jgi:hypothetical protein